MEDKPNQNVVTSILYSRTAYYTLHASGIITDNNDSVAFMKWAQVGRNRAKQRVLSQIIQHNQIRSCTVQGLIQNTISTSPSPRAMDAPNGLRATRSQCRHHAVDTSILLLMLVSLMVAITPISYLSYYKSCMFYIIHNNNFIRIKI